MKSIKSMKHIAVLTIFVMLISMFSWVSANTALAIESPVITPDFDTNEYVFDISVSGYSEGLDASIVLASYDENGTAIDKVIEPLASAYSKLSLPADKGEKSYKIMLIDAYNLKPLCSAVEGELSYGYEVLTISTDDIISATYNLVEYYADPYNSSKTSVIRVDAQAIEYNKSYGYYSLIDICYMGDTEIKFIDSDSDKIYDIVIATCYSHDIIDYVDAENDELCFVNNGIVTLDFEDPDRVAIFEDDTGRKISLSDFNSGDIVAFVCDENRPRHYTYLKVIKLTNSAVNGVVEEMYTMDGRIFLTINGIEYEDYSGYGLSLGDEGTFYIGITGKIIDFKELVKWKYGYVLQGAKSSSGFENNWEFQILTIDKGVKVYAVSDRGCDYAEMYVEQNSYELGISDPYSNDAFFGFENKNVGARLVKYELDSNGKIKYIEPATYNDSPFTIEHDSGYNSAKLILAGYNLSENAVVFHVNEYRPAETYVTDVYGLIDESLYTGFTFLDDEMEYSVVVITDRSLKFSEKKGLAIVTKISVAVDDEGNDVIKVRYMQDEDERVLIINDDTECIGIENYHSLDVGDAFMYVADSEGVAIAYTLVAEPNYYNSEFEIESMSSTLGESTEIVTGYIANTEKKTDSNGEILTFGTGDYSINEENGLFRGDSVRAYISNATNVYRYIETGRNIVIESGDFMTDDEYYADTETGMAIVHPVLVRIVDGKARDIYFLDMSKELEIKTKFTTVEEEIASIPAHLRLEDKYIVSDARESYEALTDEMKSNITNLDYLISAEKTIAELKWQEENKLSEEYGFAIVTRINTAKDHEGNECMNVSCIQDQEEIVLTFNDDSRCSGENTDIRSLNVGDVFLYRADKVDYTDNFVAHYAVVAKTSQSRDEFIITNPDNIFGEETEIITGYIANQRKATSSKGEILTIGTGDYVHGGGWFSGNGEEYLIPKSANMYTYNDSGRNVVIEVGDFMAEDVNYAQIYDDTVDVWNVLLRVVDGDVVDIYSLNTPINIPCTNAY